eukprot:scaffold141128_cov17-Prasinocladus_malaysianus.AAC.1
MRPRSHNPIQTVLIFSETIPQLERIIRVVFKTRFGEVEFVLLINTGKPSSGRQGPTFLEGASVCPHLHYQSALPSQ